MHSIANTGHRYFARQVFYVLHGEKYMTMATLGMQAVVRQLHIEGLTNIEGFEWTAVFYDMRGHEQRRQNYFSAIESELTFDSSIFFDVPATTDKRYEGCIRIEIDSARFTEPPTCPLRPNQKNFNGIFIVYRAGQFVTGSHFYHGVADFSPTTIIKYYLKAAVKTVAARFSEFRHGFGRRPWHGDAIGAAVVHGGCAGSKAIAIFHNDSPAPGFTSFCEYRSERGTIYRRHLPPLPSNSTTKLIFPPAQGESGEFAQLLFVNPPLGLSRLMQGEEAPDGALSLDHTYFQQPLDSTWGKVEEVDSFDRSLIGTPVIGPSNPWPLFHDAGTESLVATFNQFDPTQRYVLDLHVFSESGEHVINLPGWVTLQPYQFHVSNISEVLRKAGITQMLGTYLLSFNAVDNPQKLPTRLHTQALYRFPRGTWNAVSGDAHLWSSPEQPSAAIEALSRVKIRRRQLFYAPVVENTALETHLVLANLSYSLDYAEPQTLRLQYFRGMRQLGEMEVTLPPFGSRLVSMREAFGQFFAPTGDAAQEFGSVSIYPITGKTYCASFIIKDKSNGGFFIDHTLVLPKFEHEK